MYVFAGVSFLIAEGLLLSWLLWGDKKFHQTVENATHKEQTEQFVDGKITEQMPVKVIFRPAIRNAVIIVGALVAGLAGCQVASTACTVFEIIKLGAALLGVSATMLVDLCIYTIPNRYLIYMCSFRGLLFAVEIISGRPDWKESILNSVIGIGLSFVLLLFLSLVTRQGIGMGDVKLMSTIGFLCGFYAVLNTLIYALIICALFSVLLLASKKKGLKDKIPFGPFIYCGYVLTLLMGAF